MELIKPESEEESEEEEYSNNTITNDKESKTKKKIEKKESMTIEKVKNLNFEELLKNNETIIKWDKDVDKKEMSEEKNDLFESEKIEEDKINQFDIFEPTYIYPINTNNESHLRNEIEEEKEIKNEIFNNDNNNIYYENHDYKIDIDYDNPYIDNNESRLVEINDEIQNSEPSAPVINKTQIKKLENVKEEEKIKNDKLLFYDEAIEIDKIKKKNDNLFFFDETTEIDMKYIEKRNREKKIRKEKYFKQLMTLGYNLKRKRIKSNDIKISDNEKQIFQKILYITTNGWIIAYNYNKSISEFKNDKSVLWKYEIYKHSIFSGLIDTFEPRFVFKPTYFANIFLEIEFNNLYCCYSKDLYCFNAKTGEIKWCAMGGLKEKCNHHILSIPEGLLTFGVSVQFWNKTKGNELCEPFQFEPKKNFFSFSSTCSSVNADDDYLYFANSKFVKIFSRKTKEGRLHLDFFKEINNEVLDLSSSLILPLSKKYFIVSSSQSIQMIEKEKFFLFKKIKLENGPYSILRRNEKIIIVGNNTSIIAFNIEMNIQVWEYKLIDNLMYVNRMQRKNIALAQDSERIFFAFLGEIHAINPINGKVLWKKQLYQSTTFFTTLMFNNESNVLICGQTGKFYGLNPETGSRIFFNLLDDYGQRDIFFSFYSQESNINMDFLTHLCFTK